MAALLRSRAEPTERETSASPHYRSIRVGSLAAFEALRVPLRRWRDDELPGHVRVISAVEIDRPGLLEHQPDGLADGDNHVPVFVFRGGSVIDDVVVDPLDGVADREGGFH